MRISDWSSDVCSSDLAFFGTLPGTGQTIAAFISYAVEKRVAADPSRFGKGAIEGIAAPEAANNASAQTAFIPTLSLGLPGTATLDLMMGELRRASVRERVRQTVLILGVAVYIKIKKPCEHDDNH